MGGTTTQHSQWPAAAARKWLEDPRGEYAGDAGGRGHAFNALVLTGVRVVLTEGGRVLCSLRVPAPLTGADGRWHAGAIAAAVDNVCAAVVFSADGAPAVSVHSDFSYFSTAEQDEEVEMEGRVVERKGMLMAVMVEVRKKDAGTLVAIGRQWMTPRPNNTKRSKL